MFNPFRFKRMIAIGDIDTPRLFDRLATIVPAFPDMTVAAQQTDSIVVKATGARGFVRTIGTGEFRLAEGTYGKRLSVVLTLRSYEILMFAALLVSVNYFTAPERPELDPSWVTSHAIVALVLGILVVRLSTARWLRQVCAAALGQPPSEIHLEPTNRDVQTTVTAPELSSASV